MGCKIGLEVGWTGSAPTVGGRNCRAWGGVALGLTGLPGLVALAPPTWAPQPAGGMFLIGNSPDPDPGATPSGGAERFPLVGD